MPGDPEAVLILNHGRSAMTHALDSHPDRKDRARLWPGVIGFHEAWLAIATVVVQQRTEEGAHG